MNNRNYLKMLGYILVAGILCGVVGVLVEADHVIWFLFQDLFSDGRFLHTPLLYGACSVLVAYTVCIALSLLMATAFSTPLSIAASITLLVPCMFVLTASMGLYSQAGTCFKAAA